MDLKILSFNIHKATGWNRRKPTLNLIHQHIRQLHPDLIFFQEIRGSHFEMLAFETWPHSTYGKNAIYAVDDHHGNAILSKFPILTSQNMDLSMHRFEQRSLLHSVIKISDASPPVHLLCVHLGLFHGDRRKQLQKIVDFVDAEIPDNEAMILAGDFNDWTGHATKPLVNKLGLEEAFLNLHGSYAKTFPSWGAVLKLDRLYCRGFHINDAQRLLKNPWLTLSDHIALEVNLKPKKLIQHD